MTTDSTFFNIVATKPHVVFAFKTCLLYEFNLTSIEVKQPPRAGGCHTGNHGLRRLISTTSVSSFASHIKSKNPPEAEGLTKKEQVNLESVGAIGGNDTTHSK